MHSGVAGSALDSEQISKAYFTNIDLSGRCLKLWAQFNKREVNEIESMLKCYRKQIARLPPVIPTQIKEGSLYLARLHADNDYYRVTVMDTSKLHEKPALLKVSFIDFGNSDWTFLSNVRFGDERLMRYCPQACECYVDGILSTGESWSSAALEALNQRVIHERLSYVLFGSHCGLMSLDIFLDEANATTRVTQWLIENKFAIPADPSTVVAEIRRQRQPPAVADATGTFSEPPPIVVASASIRYCNASGNAQPPRQPLVLPADQQQALRQNFAVSPLNRYSTSVFRQTSPFTQQQQQYRRRTLQKRSRYDLFICYIKDPEEFYVRLSESEQELVDLMMQMNDFYQTSASRRRELTSYEIGTPCIVLHKNEDDFSLWYRGAIKQVQQNTVLVHFVDYGNDQVFNKCDVAVIDEQFLRPELYAVQSCIHGMPVRGWTDDEIRVFQSLVLTKQFKGVLIDVNDICVWEIFDSVCKRSLIVILFENWELSKENNRDIIGELTAEKNRLLTKLTNLESVHDASKENLESKIAELESEFLKSERRAIDLAGENATLKTDFSNLNERFNDAQLKLDEYARKYHDLVDTSSQYDTRAELFTCLDNLSLANARSENFSDENLKLEAQLDSALENIEIRKLETENLNKKLTNVSYEADNAKNLLEQCKADSQKCKTAEAVLSEKVKSMEEQICNVKLENAKLSTENESLKSRIKANLTDEYKSGNLKQLNHSVTKVQVVPVEQIPQEGAMVYETPEGSHGT